MTRRSYRNWSRKRKTSMRNSNKRACRENIAASRMDIASPQAGDFNIENPLNIQPTLKGLFVWCWMLLPSTFNYARSIIFPQSNSLEARLHSTQMELQEAKQQLKCLSAKFAKLEKKVSKASHDTVSCLVTAPPPAPPPPPPPPPPVNSLLKPLSLKRSAPSIVNRCDKVKQTSSKSLCVSLDDILNVKLKKTMRSDVTDKENKVPVPVKQPRITLSDITSINLRALPETSCERDNLSTPKSEVLSRVLRKTGMRRSPGGTPIVIRDKTNSTAVGPTPEIERALRRKFRSIRTSPLVEDNSFHSPR